MADPFVDAIALVVAEKLQDARTATPGKVAAVRRDEDGELDIDFDPGPAMRKGGEVTADGVVPSAPVLYPGGGGFGMTWPMAEGDEALAVVADRNVQRWRQNREPGDAHAFNRAHNLSDALVLPVTIRSPEPIGETLKITGPEGIAIEIAADGTVTISASTGEVPTTITVGADGNIAISVGTGKTINLGGSAVSPATKWDQLETAMDAFLTALVAAGAGPAYAGATAAKQAWDTAILAASPAASKVKVE